MASSHRIATPALALLARAYLDADYRWALDGDWHDLRLGLPAPGLEMCFAPCRSFGMISAWNPWSVVRDEAENRAADARLQAELADHGTVFCAAFASAPNRSWREPSWVVMDMAEDAFVALQRRYDQFGSLWWRRGTPVRMRLDAARPAEMSADLPIDWLK